MAGLDPAIQARHSLDKPRAFNTSLFRDCRVKPGNDGQRASTAKATPKISRIR